MLMGSEAELVRGAGDDATRVAGAGTAAEVGAEVVVAAAGSVAVVVGSVLGPGTPTWPSGTPERIDKPPTTVDAGVDVVESLVPSVRSLSGASDTGVTSSTGSADPKALVFRRANTRKPIAAAATSTCHQRSPVFIRWNIARLCAITTPLLPATRARWPGNRPDRRRVGYPSGADPMPDARRITPMGERSFAEADDDVGTASPQVIGDGVQKDRDPGEFSRFFHCGL